MVDLWENDYGEMVNQCENDEDFYSSNNYFYSSNNYESEKIQKQFDDTSFTKICEIFKEKDVIINKSFFSELFIDSSSINEIHSLPNTFFTYLFFIL
jgi:hypothetical protein